VPGNGLGTKPYRARCPSPSRAHGSCRGGSGPGPRGPALPPRCSIFLSLYRKSMRGARGGLPWVTGGRGSRPRPGGPGRPGAGFVPPPGLEPPSRAPCPGLATPPLPRRHDGQVRPGSPGFSWLSSREAGSRTGAGGCGPCGVGNWTSWKGRVGAAPLCRTLRGAVAAGRAETDLGRSSCGSERCLPGGRAPCSPVLRLGRCAPPRGPAGWPAPLPARSRAALGVTCSESCLNREPDSPPTLSDTGELRKAT